MKLSKSILIIDKTRKNSTVGAITGVQMLGLGVVVTGFGQEYQKYRGTFGHSQGLVGPSR